MRDLLITAIIIGAIPFILRRPHIGILMWSWVGYMSPHRMSWGFAYNFPFAQVIAVLTLISILFSKEKKTYPVTGTSTIWAIFVVWMTITTIFALDFESAIPDWERMIKIQLMVLLTLLIMQSRERLNLLVLVIAFSIGFYGIKGGVFSILSGGNFRVYGPVGSFIEENNSLALALIMVLPLMRYLQLQCKKNSHKWLYAGGMFLMTLSILTSHSRGALLGCVAIAIFFVAKSRRKLLFSIIMALVIPIFLTLMPQKWFDRMETLQTYEEDSSAMGRITAWKFAFDMAKGRFLGGGYGSFGEENYWIYSPDIASQVADRDSLYQGAHSIYFQTMGHHGFIGFILFISLWVSAFRCGTWVIRNCKGQKENKWASELAEMIQVSLIGYAVSGAFLSMADFDLFYHLVAIMILLRYYLLKQPVTDLEEIEETAGYPNQKGDNMQKGRRDISQLD